MQALSARQWEAVFFAACLAASGACGSNSISSRIAQTEDVYADAADAVAAIETIDSGLTSRYGGHDRQAWEQIYRRRLEQLVALLARLPKEGLPLNDARAVEVMRRRLDSWPVNLDRSENSMKPAGRCQDAVRNDLSYRALHEALYACFDVIGSVIEFEGERLTRVSAMDMLARLEQPERRKSLFFAIAPLWQAVNGNNRPDSPYRRLMSMAAAEARKRGSPIDVAAAAAGASSSQIEGWLEQILEIWRRTSRDQAVEPWDFWYAGGEADRVLGAFTPREALRPLSERYYRDLGADLDRLGLLYDLDPRPGKAPLAYTDFARVGRLVRGVWRPTVPRVSAGYAHGSLSALNELIHEEGHAVHYAALRTRPAFMDVDALFTEAFADVTSWNTYEPEWQRKYLGREVPESASLRSRYTSVVLDTAWSLFEIRMLRNPAADPNGLWTDITSRYLHIVPHPEWSWWALRVQLVESPGYMVNYGLGAVLTADMRQRIRESLGPFETGDARWYGWVSERLLCFGMERETAPLLREFLGRSVTPEAVLHDLRRLGVSASSRKPRS
jgi:hypothetical protein